MNVPPAYIFMLSSTDLLTGATLWQIWLGTQSQDNMAFRNYAVLFRLLISIYSICLHYEFHSSLCWHLYFINLYTCTLIFHKAVLPIGLSKKNVVSTLFGPIVWIIGTYEHINCKLLLVYDKIVISKYIKIIIPHILTHREN